MRELLFLTIKYMQHVTIHKKLEMKTMKLIITKSSLLFWFLFRFLFFFFRDGGHFFQMLLLLFYTAALLCTGRSLLRSLSQTKVTHGEKKKRK